MEGENTFKKNIIFTGKLEVITGLHIGGGSEEVKIGGVDNPVAKTIVWRDDKKIEVPYIPGSSLKGKIRKLLSSYVANPNGSGNSDIINEIFGTVAENNKTSRVIFRDCYPTEDTISRFIVEHEIELTEIKAENRIEMSMRATPRFMERVRPFTEFDFECILTIYSKDNESLYKKTIEEGIKLLEHSYLGGSGTRGYGKVKINYEIEERDLNYYRTSDST